MADTANKLDAEYLCVNVCNTYCDDDGLTRISVDLAGDYRSLRLTAQSFEFGINGVGITPKKDAKYRVTIEEIPDNA